MIRNFLPRVGFVTLAAFLMTAPAANAEEHIDARLLDERLDGFFASQISQDSLMGAVVLVEQRGVTVMHNAYGYSDAAAMRPMQTDDLFRLASMTKPIVSTALMTFVEEGSISLQAPVATYLPELADLKIAGPDGQLAEPDRQPTIHDLLRHTGGFTYSPFGAADPKIREQYALAEIEQLRTDVTAEDMLTRLADIPLAFQPGTRFEYSVGTDLLGFVIERVSGQSLSAVLKERIFQPLAMNQTSFSVEDADAPRLAEASENDPMKPFTESWMRVTTDRGEGYISGGGGLVSTAGDYQRFARMMLDGGQLDGQRILSPATVRFMLSDHIAGLETGPDAFTGPGYGFGLGFAVRREVGEAIFPGSVGDANWSGLNGTTFTIDPEQDLVAIFMTAAPTNRNDLRFAFRNILYGAVVSEIEQ